MLKILKLFPEPTVQLKHMARNTGELYINEAHNLRERRNRKDLSIRLSQFFDHFLKGAPMPVWMSKGVPATLKGIDYGYGYDEEQ